MRALLAAALLALGLAQHLVASTGEAAVSALTPAPRGQIGHP